MIDYCPIHGHCQNPLTSNGVLSCPVLIVNLNLETGEESVSDCLLPLVDPNTPKPEEP